VALALAFVVGQFMNLSVFLESFATMIGLGVGIDYSLFMLTRYRTERKAWLLRQEGSRPQNGGQW